MNVPEDSRWNELRPLLERAFDLPLAERRAFLRDACAGDGALLAEALSLLEAEDTEEDPLGGGLGAVAPLLVRELAGDDGERPEAVGPYRILGRLGAGGMSTVYLAERSDEQFRQQVAVKVLAAGRADTDLIRRFHNERQILAGLRHPHVARLLDGGVTGDGTPYMVMELVDGEPLDQYCDRRRLPLEARLKLFEQVCDAVQYAHQNLVVHRDIKPSNVLVDETGNVKLLDFGIAKVLNPDLSRLDPHVTRTHLRLLTPRYASPEQILGERVTTASDVYSLGVLLYQLLVGRSPYRAEDTGAVQRAVLEELPDAPSAALFRDPGPPAADIAAARGLTPKRLRRRLRGDLDVIVTKVLRKEPVRRYASAGQLAEDLAHFRAGQPVHARRDTRIYRLRKWLARHRTMAVAFTFTITLAAVSLGAFLTQSNDLAETRAAVERSRRMADARAKVLADFLEPLREPSDAVPVDTILANAVRRLEEVEDDTIRADVLEAVSGVYRDRAENVEARPLIEQAVEVRQRLANGAGEEERASTLLALARAEQLLGEVYRGLGLRGRAIQVLEKCLAELRTVRGPVHADVADALLNLSYSLGVVGDREQAEALRREALAIRLEVFGPDHTEVASAYLALASMLRIRGKLREAERAVRSAVRLRRVTLGNDHPLVASALREQAEILLDLGSLDVAEAAVREALRILKARAPADFNETRFILARLFHARGEWQRARAEIEEVITVDGELLPQGSIRGAMYRILEARTALALGDPEGARTAIRKAFEVQAAVTLSDRHRSRAWAVHVDGLIALAAGDLEHAERQLLAADRAFREQQVPEGWKRRTSLAALARLYDVQGRTDEAAACRRELREAEAVLQRPLDADDREKIPRP